MNPSLSAAAAKLLDFISTFESSESARGYLTIYGNHQDRLAKPITTMSLNELMANQRVWGRTYGSSAAGRYQFMPATLASLVKALGLSGREIFTPDLQDLLGFELLKRRGFTGFMSGALTMVQFGLGLAQEWASLPVLADTRGARIPVRRGQSYYAGVFTNRAGVAPEAVESVLQAVLRLPIVSTVTNKTSEGTMANTSPTNVPTPVAPSADAKPWYLSKGVIGGLIAVALPLLSLFFPAARVIDPSVATDWVVKILQVAGPVIGGAIAILGRVQATVPIKGTKAAQSGGFFNGDMGLPALPTGMLDLPLSTIAADLPQVLLILQNAAQVMSATTGGVSGPAPMAKIASDGGTEEPATKPAPAVANDIPNDPAQLTVAHLQALASLAAKLGDLAPTLANLFAASGGTRLQQVAKPTGT